MSHPTLDPTLTVFEPLGKTHERRYRVQMTVLQAKYKRTIQIYQGDEASDSESPERGSNPKGIKGGHLSGSPALSFRPASQPASDKIAESIEGSARIKKEVGSWDGVVCSCRLLNESVKLMLRR